MAATDKGVHRPTRLTVLEVQQLIQGAGFVAGLGTQGVAGRGAKVSCLGDSITADAVLNNASDYSWRGIRFPTWLRTLSGRRLDLSFAGIFATTGFTTQQIIATHLPNAVAYKAQITTVLCGTNNITFNQTADQITADLVTIYTALRNAGAVVVACSIPPRNVAAGLTATQLRTQAAVNLWIANYCAATPGMLFADTASALTDSTTGQAATGMISSDNLHPSPLGAYTMGQVVSTVVNSLLPARGGSFINPLDVWNATENPGGNLISVGLMAGTGGTLTGTGTSGQVATGWSGVIQTPGTVTAAFSKEADATGTNLERQVVTLGGTGNAGSQPGGGTRVSVGLPVFVSNIAAGDTVFLEAEVEWSGASGVVGFHPNLGFGAPVGINVSDNFLYTALDGDLPPTSGGRLNLRTPNFVVPANFVAPSLLIGIYPKASGSIAGTFKIGRVAVRKVQPSS